MQYQVASVVSFVALAMVACAAPRPAATSLTGADVRSSETAAETPSSTPVAETPTGKLACRTKSIQDGTRELYLDWNGDAAKGTLRTIAPSGVVTTQSVKAERFKDMIVADEPGSQDLVSHAATVREHDGKRYLRTGDYQGGWKVCE